MNTGFGMMTEQRARYGLLLVCAFFLSGCAALPVGRLVPDHEAARVLNDFQRWRISQQQCPAGIDAEATVTFYGLLSSASINGYLFAFAPAYLRFEGVNPLGLTENIFTTNGHNYSYLLIRRQAAYTGLMNSDRVREYITPRQAASISSWLLGRLPTDSHAAAAVRRNNDGDYWLTLAVHDTAGAAGGGAARVLFSPDRNNGGISKPARLRAYVTRAGGAHGPLALVYHYPDTSAKTTANCAIPDLVSASLGSRRVMSLAIRDPYPLAHLAAKQFSVRIPPNFARTKLP
jgi:hypothetical protein